MVSRHAGDGELMKDVAMTKDTEGDVGEISGREELKFIIQAAFAPITIMRKVIRDHKPVWTAFVQTVDREAYVRDLRARESGVRRSKRPATPA